MQVYKQMIKKNIYLIICIAICISFGSGILIEREVIHKVCTSGYKYINPSLWCPGSNVNSKQEYNLLSEKISGYLTQEETSGNLKRGSVYFRDLEDGPTFGINSQEEFVPASLLKVPLMITYLRLAENMPSLLGTKLKFELQAIPNQQQFFKPSHGIEQGGVYSIQELLFDMIAYSDNYSYYLLTEYLSSINPSANELLKTYQELGIIEPNNDTDQTISTKDYAAIFRTLYNTSYLSKQSSEMALSMLDAADFDKGLVAGVNKDETVAHKFGERSDPPGNLKQLHDCGIIYNSKNPYLLCIMTEGNDFNKLLGIIDNVSKMVNDEVNSR